MEQPAATEIDLGTVLAGTYEITRLIGRGGMGAVWEARHARLPGKRVAVKVLLGGAASDREAFARFRREAEIASQIGHPNIIEVHDFNVLPSGTPYLVLEFLDGEDLAARLARGPIPLDEALGILRQIGSALGAAHRADVVHRDLKPANIFLCPTDEGGVLAERVKVLDFGISKIRNSQTVQTQDSILLGTPQYMSPEQASGKNQELDQRTDVFALGAITYEMLTGKPAFAGPSLVAIVFKVVYEANPTLATVQPPLPRHVIDAVDRALAKEPAARWQDVQSFLAALTGQKMATLDRNRVPRRPSVDAALAATSAAPSASGPGANPESVARGSDSLQASAARGEVAPAVETPVGNEAPAQRRTIALLAFAAAVTAFAVYGMVRVAHRSSVAVAPSARATRRLPVLPQSVVVEEDASIQPDLAAPFDLRPATPPLDLAPAMRGTTTHHPSGRTLETLPPEVEAELADAERALDGGDAAGAIRIARHSLYAAKSARAFAIMTRAYCKAGDLGNAKSSFHSVTGVERVSVARYCKSAGTEIE